MWNALIRWSLEKRLAVVAGALMLAGYGAWTASRMAIDVLPDVTAPTVTVITEAHGMAPDEVESLVTVPVETSLHGAPGVRRLRSQSGIGMSIVWAEFDWDVEAFRARQVVAERVRLARESLPTGVGQPTLAPMSSVMGEILFLGVVGEDGADPMLVRDVAEWQVRRRLLGVAGVAQVMPIGGALKQVQVVLRPDAMRRLAVGHRRVLEVLEGASQNAPGGFYVSGHHEYLIRGVGRARTLDELGAVAVARRHGRAVLLREIADVRLGPALSRGTAAVDGTPAVVLAVQKQPDADTLGLTARIDSALDDLVATLPPGVSLYRKGFRQSRFIVVALSNVTRHIAESALLVVLLLALFLASWRTTLISLVALPLSLLAGIVVLRWLGQSMNTMTLGGFAIAIGALVDDAIIDVENVYRRLRQRAELPQGERPPLLETVYRASVEIRSSIVLATAVIVVVFVPMFFLGGLEGRLLAPLGTAYVVSLVASLIVAVTATPALCLLLLRDVEPMTARRESLLARSVKAAYRPLLDAALGHPRTVVLFAVVLTAAALAHATTLGRSFLPRFNEGSFTIAAATVAGAPLEASDRMVHRLEQALVELDVVTSVIRRTGRAERDEHAQDVQYSELEVTVDSELASRPEAARRIRAAAAGVPGLTVSVGQPISHRVAHMLSGVRTSIAVKVFGEDLVALRGLAQRVQDAMSGVAGVVDLAVEPQTDVPQLLVRARPALGRIGMSPGDLAEFVETAFLGHSVGQWWERQRSYDLVVRYPDRFRADDTALASTPIDSDGEVFVPLAEVARLDKTLGPNLIGRENVQRRIVVMANVAGRDLHGVIEEIRSRVDESVDLPTGYYVEYGGEFQSEERASRTLAVLSALALAAMLAILWVAFRSVRDAALVMVNLPLALIGGVVAVALSDGVLSVASLVGFITLFGIACRNGILLLTHYRHLVEHEGETRAGAVRRGSLERLVPVLMTALATGLALVPIALAAGEPGNEIQAPMALVVLGGLTSSTFLNLVVVPTLALRYGSRWGSAPPDA